MEKPIKRKPGRPSSGIVTVPYRRLVRPEFIPSMDSYLELLRRQLSQETAIPEGTLTGTPIPASQLTGAIVKIRREDPETFTREKQTRKAKGAK
jgi:hypothetical protein